MSITAEQATQRTSDNGTADRRPGFEPETANGRAEMYEQFVYELACRITASPEEAEAALEEMMSDIRRSADGPVLTFKERIIERIALFRILK